MIKQLTFLFLVCFCNLHNCVGQDSYPDTKKHSFFEWNFGVAAVEDYVIPGTSFLWGATTINENNSIFEYEVGFALPTLITGKMGGGKVFGNTKVVLGVRPFPFNFYIQTSFLHGERGYWVFSVEYNPFDEDMALSFGSKGLLNLGYRWHRD